MTKSRKSLLIAGIVGASIMLGISLKLPNQGAIRSADAQTVEFDQEKRNYYNYKAYKVQDIIPTRSTDNIEEVIPLKESPNFLVRTEDAITVWSHVDGKLLRLREIPIDGKFREVVLLEDYKTFVVRSREKAAVYSVERDYVSDRERIRLDKRRN